MKRTQALLGAALLAVTSLAAQAQTIEPQPKLRMDSGFYIGGAAGRARASGGCVGACDDRDTTYHAFAGYQFNRFFAAEAGYADFGSITRSGTIFGGTAAARVDTTAWEVAALAMAPISDRFSLYAKLGMYHYSSDAVVTGAVVGNTDANGTEYTIGLGAQYSITDYIGLRFEWQRYNDVGSGVQGLAKDDVKVWRLGGRVKF
jgi:OOP family OmpA-OmpF porin